MRYRKTTSHNQQSAHVKGIYAYKWLAIAAACLLAGCAAIPISTALRLSSMSRRTLAYTDPAQVRVKLSVPEGFTIKVAASRLTLKLTGPAGTQTGEMGLALLNLTHGVRSGGWFRHDISVITYTLALNRSGVAKLRELQQFLLKNKPGTVHFEFSVMAPIAHSPADATSVEFWADLKLRNDEPFMSLLDGAKLKYPHGSGSK